MKLFKSEFYDYWNAWSLDLPFFRFVTILQPVSEWYRIPTKTRIWRNNSPDDDWTGYRFGPFEVSWPRRRKDDHCPCFECDTGFYKEERRSYPYYKQSFDKEPVAWISNVPHEVCDHCGDVCFSRRGLEAIEEGKKRYAKSTWRKTIRQ